MAARRTRWRPPPTATIRWAASPAWRTPRAATTCSRPTAGRTTVSPAPGWDLVRRVADRTRGGHGCAAVYAAPGRITQMVSQDGTSDYGYDSKSQLTSATHTYQTNESYSYDNNGNRTMTGYQTGRRQPADQRRHVLVPVRRRRQPYPPHQDGHRRGDRVRVGLSQPAGEGDGEELARHDHAGGRVHL